MRRGREMGAALLIAFGLFSLLSIHSTLTGQVGVFISYWLTLWLGVGAGLPGLYVAWTGIGLWRRALDWRELRRFAGVICVVGVGLTGLHVAGRVLAWPTEWSPRAEMAVEGAWGGQVGGLLAGAAMKYLGPLGTFLVSGLLLLVGWVLVVDRPPGDWLAAWRRRSASNDTDGDAIEPVETPEDRPQKPGMLARWRARRAAKAAREELAATSGTTNPVRSRRRSRRNKRTEDEGDNGSVASFTLDTFEDGEGPSDNGRRRGAEAPSTAASDNSPSRSSAGRRRTSPKSVQMSSGSYVLPALGLLERPKPVRRTRGAEADDGRAQLLEETLASFGIEGRVVSVSRGPTVTRYEVQPPAGVKVSRIVGLADDISLALAAAGVRIEAPVPGKSVVGIEVPNTDTSPVVLREILESEEFQTSRSHLTVGLGRDIAGKPLVADLQKLLHLLIAGATGSGKSVCLNSIITSLLYKADPEQVKMMMIDPKRVELSVYDGIPHLITPVVTDPKEAASALRWAVKEMERRYQLLSQTGVRNLDAYNRRRRKPEGLDEFVPYLVVIIDELADLMLVASADVENSIVRLAQMARAAGIYLIIATQRPSVDVITGLIKANVPSRLAFAVSSQVDSRTILDMGGAERLLGRGDMLFHPIGAPKPVRAQGAWVSDAEVEAVADAWRDQAEPEYIENVTETPTPEAAAEEEAEDELFEQAVALVREQGHASVSMLQRRFRIGYARAARLIDVMEVQGIVGPYQGSKPREVIGVDGAI